MLKNKPSRFQSLLIAKLKHKCISVNYSRSQNNVCTCYVGLHKYASRQRALNFFYWHINFSSYSPIFHFTPIRCPQFVPVDHSTGTYTANITESRQKFGIRLFKHVKLSAQCKMKLGLS